MINFKRKILFLLRIVIENDLNLVEIYLYIVFF